MYLYNIKNMCIYILGFRAGRVEEKKPKPEYPQKIWVSDFGAFGFDIKTLFSVRVWIFGPLGFAHP